MSSYPIEFANPIEEELTMVDTDDPIHPQHYKVEPQVVHEVADVVEMFGLGEDWHLGTAVKYILRAGKKGPDKFAEDLKKAVWYIERRIELERKVGGGVIDEKT